MNEAQQATNWLPGVIFVAVGLGIALLFLMTQLKRAKAAPASTRDETLANLERRAQMLMDQLKELNAERHTMDAARFEAEKGRLEGEAAAALRARDEFARGGAAAAPGPAAVPNAGAVATAAVPSEAPKKGFGAEHPQLVGALWGGGAVLFFVVLGLVLSQEQGKKDDRGMGAPGPMQQATAPAPGDEDRELSQGMQEVSQHPENVELAAKVAHELLRLQRFPEAMNVTERALGMDPFQVENRIHRAVLRSTQGQAELAMSELEHLAITYPHSEEARLFLGGLRMDLGDKKGAADEFQRYLVEAPPGEVPPQLPQVIEQLKNGQMPTP